MSHCIGDPAAQRFAHARHRGCYSSRLLRFRGYASTMQISLSSRRRVQAPGTKGSRVKSVRSLHRYPEPCFVMQKRSGARVSNLCPSGYLPLHNRASRICELLPCNKTVPRWKI